MGYICTFKVVTKNDDRPWILQFVWFKLFCLLYIQWWSIYDFIFVNNILLLDFVLLFGWFDFESLPNSSFGITAWLCSQELNGVLGANPSWPLVRNFPTHSIFFSPQHSNFWLPNYYHYEDIFTWIFLCFLTLERSKPLHCSKGRFKKNYRV